MKVEAYVTWVFEITCPYCNDEKMGSMRVHLFEDKEVKKALMCSNCQEMMCELRYVCDSVGYTCIQYQDGNLWDRVKFNVISSVKERIS